jgi:cyclophilin family peptidyl-prolyl cis-trans isomerase
LKWAITAASANMLPGIEIDSLRQDIINWGMSDPNRLVRWYTIAVSFKFRQDRRNELGTYLTDLTVDNIDSLLPEYATPPLARIETTRGTITVELNTEIAPRTVRQFIANAKSGVYDATPVNDVQGGQLVVLGDRWGDESSLPPANVRDEYSHLRAEAGTVMWSLVSRDSGRGNFMIALTRLPYQDWRYPIFGQIREGLDVARKLTMADTVRTIQIMTSGIS